ncbi:zincin-like metallopeptidase domain-containing protein [Planococcus sp. S3-L1]|uniref:ArdC family protein n=1 Tax=Planococcus sp. S3-L1 TaxID=3046200 RepID=UPI0024B8D19A|nr:zincin-like metallopeptidase domain-containing protein [Planococcus sp. S3-L1]MDJ0333288.1 zincin-like metallopeptidase domain-containing protein [Planococcus sp. S3-L1]
MSKKIYETITNKIIQKLEEGTIPWRMPFENGLAVNWVNQKPYRGINVFLLDGGEYATFKQIRDNGGTVKKGEKGQAIIFWKMLDGEDKETGEDKKIPLLKTYTVFKVGEQTKGIEPKRKPIEHTQPSIEQAEEILKNYENAPDFTAVSGRAFYSPSKDIVNIPPKGDFKNINHYYSVLFHEMVHSTGHKDRLNRPGIVEMNGFGTERYSKEELIAELGASMLSGVAQIDNSTLENSASYIQSWLHALNNDHSLIVNASQLAQKASDHILGTTFE